MTKRKQRQLPTIIEEPPPYHAPYWIHSKTPVIRQPTVGTEVRPQTLEQVLAYSQARMKEMRRRENEEPWTLVGGRIIMKLCKL